MVNERYLEYLALNSILQDYVEMICLNDYYQDECYLLNNHMQIDLDKIKARVIELQKEFLAPYVIDSTSNDD